MNPLLTFLDIALAENTPLASAILATPLVAAPLSRGAAPPSRQQPLEN